jgi:undecaprenyl-diphosphatase
MTQPMTWMSRPKEKISALWAFARSEAVLLLGLSVVAGAVLLFSGIADEMAEGDTHGVDMAILTALQPEPGKPIGPAWLEHAAMDFTALGSVSILLTATLAATGFLMLRRKWPEAGLLVAAFAGGLVLSETIKAVFGRARPPEAYRLAEALNPSFPSGHALLSAVVFLTLGALLARATDKRQLRGYIIGVAIVISLLVGATRIYLGVHWASDVLAGWSLGAALATIIWLLDRLVRSRKPAAGEGG